MKDRDCLVKLCVNALQAKGFNDLKYKERLKQEIKEIDVQSEHEYFLKLYEKGCKFSSNENNLFVAYLLDVVEEFDIDQPPVFIQGEFPDIDIDYLPVVRDYLKNKWAAKRFGQENICSIGTYGTLGIKSAILDMTKVHGVSKDVIQSITVRMTDKDDEGKSLTWDKALELYPDFAKFCEQNPDISEAARLLINRNKSGGVHAGGLIISSKRIDDFVPLEVRGKKKEGVIASAWSEGLSAQDLQPVGLIKFDLLVIENLTQIALACKLIKDRHNIKSICALVDGSDWSDITYLNDSKSIEMANLGDLKCVFQFDSEGIRKLVSRGGVTSFDDLMAYSALYRPGPLNLGMDIRYCKRKKKNEEYELHPLIRPILGKTYGVMVFQEQVMQILNKVGDIPLIHCEKVRKAISKKQIEGFIKYKEMFIEKGQENLDTDCETVENLWKQIEAFAEYGFNASHSCAYTYISSRLLWLKAHYPLEFYCAVLMCEKQEDKIKDYIRDADDHGVDVLPVHINKSGVNFRIVDEDIYFGFSNIKTIGKEVAKRITDSQPYVSFVDFLERFGIDLTPIKALVSLGVFEDDHDRLTLYKYFEFYKKMIKKRKERVKRVKESLKRYQEEIEELNEIGRAAGHSEVPEFLDKMNKFDEESYKLWEYYYENIEREVEYKYLGEIRTRIVTLCKQLMNVRDKRDKSIRNFKQKEKDFESDLLSLGEFNVSRIKVDPKVEKVLTDSWDNQYPLAELEYYGFQWVHDLEKCKDYEGFTIKKFLDLVQEKNIIVGMIEVQMVILRDKKSKKGTEYHSLEVEDADGKKAYITFWSDDYIRWKDELKEGNLVKIRVRPPNIGYRTFTFDSPPRHQRSKLLPPTKDEDYRLIIMKLEREENTIDLTDLNLDRDYMVV